jgi:hypothetical protein
MLESAPCHVLGQFPLSFETAADWATMLADLEFYGPGRDYIEGYPPALRWISPKRPPSSPMPIRARRISSSC